MATTTIKSKPILKKKISKTSKAAASDNLVRKTQRFLLLEAFYKAGKNGLTAEEAGAAADLLHTGYWKRVSELSNAFLIDPVEKSTATYEIVTRATSSGRQAMVFRISYEGKEEYKRLRKVK